ncbi:MAG: S-adenosylmethionine tRNA ribosyltransferase [Pseudopedobacter saltans]|uniref:S-adenosylmethionine tRNA ribosyltransferase n=1 Tax=Pseudopedobacter saltans TaxID=151895 RepID=A0A2W5GXV0_9SPHI|nr:MAG: S-adenosylmethionine tRNA ribosyltransferase [Pseudopedobacter saltans]
MHPKDISIQDYTYELPDSRIAKYPLPQRDASKLLVFNTDHSIQENTYAHISDYIPENSFLVFNNTKVVEARIFFQKSTGSSIEIFCLEPDDRYSDITSAMLETGEVYWKCLVGGAKKWKEGALTRNFEGKNGDVELAVEKVEKRNDYFLVHLYWSDKTLSFAEVLHYAGIIPLPPYLNRETEVSDNERYQTVYAKYDGSVAAPTAGLHFTENVLDSLKKKNCHYDFVTLHVGAGTFKPVKAEHMADHEMHYEAMDISLTFLKNLLSNIAKDHNIVTVGTTSMRTIESLYWIGVQAFQGKLEPLNIEVLQWAPYENPSNISAEESIGSLIDWMQMQHIERIFAKTQIIIAPGYQLKIVNGLVTNFHQPQSTLILLVSAIVGDYWKTIYQYAMEHEFRFLSYGDGSLLWKQKK